MGRGVASLSKSLHVRWTGSVVVPNIPIVNRFCSRCVSLEWAKQVNSGELATRTDRHDLFGSRRSFRGEVMISKISAAG